MKNCLLSFLLLLLFCQCSSDLHLPDNEVFQVGQFNKLMYSDVSGPTLSLDTLQHIDHLDALGVCTDLDGEVLIWDGTPTISKPNDGHVVLSHQWDQSASMLVFAKVPAWREVDLPAEIENLPALERWIVRNLKAYGLEGRPFPFLLRGRVSSLYWYVIDLKGQPKDGNLLEYRSNSPNGHFQESEVEVLGFFSQKHQGIWTQEGNFSHAHFITKDGTLSGHVDKLYMDGGMRLYLPAS